MRATGVFEPERLRIELDEDGSSAPTTSSPSRTAPSVAGVIAALPSEQACEDGRGQLVEVMGFEPTASSMRPKRSSRAELHPLGLDRLLASDRLVRTQDERLRSGHPSAPATQTRQAGPEPRWVD